MDDDLIGELQALSAEAPPFTPRDLKDANNKWLVRSAMQKAMRRGQVDVALRMGEFMIKIDPTYAWQTLATVIVEDIGIGDPDLLAYSCVATLKSLRDNLEAPMLFAAMIKRGCEASKSRSACEVDLALNMLMEMEPEGMYVKNYAALVNEKVTDEVAMKKMLGLDEGLVPKHLATRALRKRLRSKGEDVLNPALQLIMDNLSDPTEKRAAMFSFERTVDTMNLAIFPLYHWLNSIPDEVITDTPEKAEWPESVMIKTVPSEAYDMHTRAGSKAIRAFWKWLIEENKHPVFSMIKDGKAKRAIGSLLFIVEGGMLDSRLRSKHLDMTKDLQDVTFAMGYSGLPELGSALPEILPIIHKNIPKLNELRQWAVDSE